jgi:hypothetical protein
LQHDKHINCKFLKHFSCKYGHLIFIRRIITQQCSSCKETTTSIATLQSTSIATQQALQLQHGKHFNCNSSSTQFSIMPSDCNSSRKPSDGNIIYFLNDKLQLRLLPVTTRKIHQLQLQYILVATRKNKALQLQPRKKIQLQLVNKAK